MTNPTWPPEVVEQCARAIGESIYTYVDPNSTPNTWASSERAAHAMKIVAADPGLTGALAFYDVSNSYLSVADMPVLRSARKSGGDKLAIDQHELLALMRMWGDFGATHFVVEEVGGLPKQSAPNAFSFGFGCGLLRMAAVVCGYRIEPVTPQRWKAVMRVSTTPMQIRARANEVFPAFAHYWQQGKLTAKSEVGIGRAEAALLAAYGERTLTGAR